MAKKLGKLLLCLSAAAAVGAGVYYWIKKKEACETEEEFDEDFEDEDFKLDEDLKDVSERGYVSLTPSSKAKDPEEEKEEDTEEEEDAEAKEKKVSSKDAAK